MKNIKQGIAAGQISKRIQDAVETERTSSEYAKNFYETEAEMEKLFILDTQLLDNLLYPKGKLFDAMMARGRHILYFTKKGYYVTGNDRNKHMVSLVRKELKKEKLKAKLYNLDATNLSAIKGGTFDYVICMYSSLGCIPGSKNRQKAMQEFARVTKLGGLVIVHAHNRHGQIFEDPFWLIGNSFFRKESIEAGDMYYFHSKQLGYSYIHFFEPSEMRHAFRNAGLSIVKEIYINRNQNGQYRGPLKSIVSAGFIFVGRKRHAIS